MRLNLYLAHQNAYHMKYFFQILLLLITGNAIAQSSFKDGYYIDNKGDTVKGFISYNYRGVTSKSIEFKSKLEDATIKTLDATQIRAFYVAPGTTCISYTGELSLNRNRFPDIDTQKDTSTKTATVFLKELLIGQNVSLYTHTDPIKTRYFYREGSGKPIELLYYEFGYTEQKYKTVVAQFIEQLINLFNKYNGINDDKIYSLQNTKFTQGDLEFAMRIINANKINYKGVSTSDSRFFIGAAFLSASSSVRSIISPTPPITAVNFSPKLNLGYDIFTAPSKKIILRGEFSLSSIKPSYSFSYSPNGTTTVTTGNTYYLSTTIVSFVPQVIYNFYNTKALKIFAGAGVSFNFSAYSDKLVYTQVTNYAPYTTQQNTGYNNITYPIFSPTFPVEAGISLNDKIEISCIYNFAVGSQASDSFKATTFGAGINYLFK